MLKRVIVENFALIERLDVEFDKQLNIITGETGAGKSIILGAMGLIMGAKADAAQIRSGAKNCVVEMHFTVEEPTMRDVFEELELEYDRDTVIRRVVSTEGKSRAYVNDLPVTQAVLKSLTSWLIDIHSQHQTQLLGETKFQINLIDKVAANDALIGEYRTAYVTLQSAKSELKHLIETAEQSRRDVDYIQFQYDQLNEAELVEGEQEELEAQITQLTHASEIKQSMFESEQLMNNDQGGVVPMLKSAEQLMSKLGRVYPTADVLAERLKDALIELKDVAAEMEAEAERVEVDPEKLAECEQRLDLIFSLQQKHRVTTVADLLALQNEFEQSLSRIESYDQEIERLRGVLEQKRIETENLARKLTAARVGIKNEVKDYVEQNLAMLGMPNVSFAVEITPREELDIDGADTIRFVFSANKNVPMQPIEKIASGGEMSRLMLTLKSLVAKHKSMPTIIFDEIDTGISGEIAHKMGEIIEAISSTMQIINITHLPQIAARGISHYFVYKHDTEDGTSTHIRKLCGDDRITEIAKMISGSDVTQAARQQAAILLDKRQGI